MKLNLIEIRQLDQALNELDGRKETRMVDGRAVEVFRSYQLSPAARWKLAKAKRLLAAAINDFEAARQKLVFHHSGGTGKIEQGSAQFAAFLTEFMALQAAEEELAIEPITPADLCLEANENAGNGMPIAVLSALGKLVVG